MFVMVSLKTQESFNSTTKNLDCSADVCVWDFESLGFAPLVYILCKGHQSRYAWGMWALAYLLNCGVTNFDLATLRALRKI